MPKLGMKVMRRQQLIDSSTKTWMSFLNKQKVTAKITLTTYLNCTVFVKKLPISIGVMAIHSILLNTHLDKKQATVSAQGTHS